MVIGLLGGSLDPAHERHAHLKRAAIKRTGLHAVWWLLSPGKPQKARQPAPLVADIDADAARQEALRPT